MNKGDNGKLHGFKTLSEESMEIYFSEQSSI